MRRMQSSAHTIAASVVVTAAFPACFGAACVVQSYMIYRKHGLDGSAFCLVAG